MAEALYRKYRPQTFEDVVGQTHIERTLKNAIESDKVSHAYLFCGPRGTGKTTTARLLAKALLCEGGPTPSPDGTCEQCQAIADGVHPDVSELDAASRTGVENVREEIIGRVQYAPTRGRYKIYIIDEVHMLSTAAFNALLKTLEEPPSHVVFVLCTTDPQRVPETIHSRCQRFDFHRLSNEEIVSRLGAVCVAEGVEFEGDALDLVAHRAQGGMRDALTALEQLIAFGGGKVTVEVAQSVLGSIDADDMSTVVGAIAARDAAACFTWLSDYVETGADLARFARDLAGYVRDLYVLALTDGAVALDAPQASRPAMAKEAELFGVDRLAYLLGVLGDLSAELRSSVNPRLSFEIALTRMVRPESDLTLEALAARVATLEAALSSGACAPGAAVFSQVPSAAGASASAAHGEGAGESFRPSSAVSSVASNPAASQDDVPVQKAAPATVLPVSSGYGHAPASAPAPASQGLESVVSSKNAAAMDKAAAFRAELERRRSAKAPSSSEPAPRVVAAPSQAQVEASGLQAPDGNVSDHVRAKINDPSALQRGWQATLAELKRRRAAYGALMLSARVVARQDGNGLVIEFSRENSFAFAAAQKPDIAAAIAQALESAFGAPVPFSITQGEGATSPVQAAMARAAAMRKAAAGAEASGAAQAASHASAAEPHAISAPHAADDVAPYDDADVVPYDDADVVPYDDADVASYSDADAESFAPWDDPYVPNGPAAVGGPATASGLAAVSEPAALESGDLPAQRAQADVSADESAASAQAEAPFFALSVEGPEPVDPYAVGKKLGFDSMPARKKRPKGMISPKGWPGAGDAKGQSASRLDESSEKRDGTANEGDAAAAENTQITAGSDANRPSSPASRKAPEGGALPSGPSAAASAAGASDSFGADSSDVSRKSSGSGVDAPASASFAPSASVVSRGSHSPGDPAVESSLGQSSPRAEGSSFTAAGRVDAPAGRAVFEQVGVSPAARSNPFASRPMPAGIGSSSSSSSERRPSSGQPSSPASVSEASDAGAEGAGMDVADIFGAFGVSFNEVEEER